MMIGWRAKLKDVSTFRGLLTTRKYAKDSKRSSDSCDDEEDEKKERCEWDLATCSVRRTTSDCNDDMAAIDRETPQPCVVIVGAGIAGLSAARRLVQCGITNLKVLEALERPGGRVRSCWLGDSVVELGSETISGACLANKMYTLAAQEGIIKYPLERVDESCGPLLTSDGRSIPKLMAQKAGEIFEAILSRATDACHTRDPTVKDCLMGFFDDQVALELENVHETERYDVARGLYGLANGLRTRLGEDLSGVSTTGFGCYRQLPGGNSRVRLGMAGILSPLIRELPEGTVQYCKPVHAIRWGTTGYGGGCCPRAVVVTDDNTEFPADYVIVTVSLGVLKVVSDFLFCPALPGVKMDAIQSVGYGNVNKVFLQYDRPFWVDNGSAACLAWSAQEIDKRDSWIKGISGFRGVSGSRRNLAIVVGGPEARELEHNTDAQVVKGVTELLRKFTGDPSLPSPVSMIRSCWSTDQHFYGSYTYPSVDSGEGHFRDLGAPLPDNPNVPPIILFAGEHTSPKYYGTMHGARDSGIREADRVICLTKKFNGPPGTSSCPTCCIPPCP